MSAVRGLFLLYNNHVDISILSIIVRLTVSHSTDHVLVYLMILAELF